MICQMYPMGHKLITRHFFYEAHFLNSPSRVGLLPQCSSDQSKRLVKRFPLDFTDVGPFAWENIPRISGVLVAALYLVHDGPRWTYFKKPIERRLGHQDFD